MRILRLPSDEVEGLQFVDGGVVIHRLAFGPDSQTLAVVLGSGMSWWDLRQNSRLETLYPSGEHRYWSADPVLSPDHQLLAQQADEVFSSVLVSDRSALRRGERLLEEPGGSRMYRSLSAIAISGDVGLVAAATSGGGDDPSTIHLWDAAQALQRPAREDPWSDPIAPLPVEGLSAPAEVSCLAFGPGWLAAGLASGVVARWELPSGRSLPSLDAPGDAVRRLVLSPNGRTLAAVGGPAVTLFDAVTGEPRAVLEDDYDVLDVAFHPAGRTLATVCGAPVETWYDAYMEDEPGKMPDLARFPLGQGVLGLWDVAAGLRRQQLDWEVGALSAVAFSPDGCTGAAGGELGQIVLWDVEEG